MERRAVPDVVELRGFYHFSELCLRFKPGCSLILIRTRAPSCLTAFHLSGLCVLLTCLLILNPLSELWGLLYVLPTTLSQLNLCPTVAWVSQIDNKVIRLRFLLLRNDRKLCIMVWRGQVTLCIGAWVDCIDVALWDCLSNAFFKSVDHTLRNYWLLLWHKLLACVDSWCWNVHLVFF